MSRRGFALFTVLWVITALSVLAGTGLIKARLGSETTRNRILLARAAWAREACIEILQARFATDATVRAVGPVDLGRGTWCRARLEDPAAKLNVNTADRATLAALLRTLGERETLADSIVHRRRQAPLYDLAEVIRGSALAQRLAPFFTTRGTGVVNVNAAPSEIIEILPGATRETAFVITSRRGARALRSADDLAAVLSRSARAALLNSYAEFVRAAVFDPPQLVAAVEGGIVNTPIQARVTLTMVPIPGRLAVIRRESE